MVWPTLVVVEALSAVIFLFLLLVASILVNPPLVDVANPTVTPNLVLLTWHSGGFHVIDIANEAKPKQSGWFSPTPLPAVATDDPALNGGPNKVTMWSYPVVDDGLIYVIDLRNGLYILEYRGKFTGEIRKLDYLEGNSNQGDAPALEAGG